MLDESQFDTAIAVLQLVALVLPAIAIWLQVLVQHYQEPFDMNTGEFVQPEKITPPDTPPSTLELTMRPKTEDKLNYTLAQWGIHSFIFGAFSVLISLGIHINDLLAVLIAPIVFLNLGLVLVFTGFTFFGISVIETDPKLWRRLPEMLYSKIQ